MSLHCELMYVATVYMKHKGRNILSGYEKRNLYEKEYCVEHSIAKAKVFTQFISHITKILLSLKTIHVYNTLLVNHFINNIITYS